MNQFAYILKSYFLLLILFSNGIALGSCATLMSHIGSNINGEIETLSSGRNQLIDEQKRLAASKYDLTREEEVAVANYELLDPSPDAYERPSSFYQRRLTGLLSFVEIELRRRQATILYSEIKEQLPPGVTINDAIAFRIVRRFLGQSGKDKIGPTQLIDLLEVFRGEEILKDARHKLDETTRGLYRLRSELKSLEGREGILNSARTDTWYKLTPEAIAEEMPKVQNKIAELKRQIPEEEVKIKPVVSPLKAQIESLVSNEKLLFEKLAGLFEDFNAMRSALLLEDKARGCCSKGCWNCIFNKNMRLVNKEDFFEGLIEITPKPPLFDNSKLPHGPRPNLALYKVQDDLKEVLPYLGN